MNKYNDIQEKWYNALRRKPWTAGVQFTYMYSKDGAHWNIKISPSFPLYLSILIG